MLVALGCPPVALLLKPPAPSLPPSDMERSLSMQVMNSLSSLTRWRNTIRAALLIGSVFSAASQTGYVYAEVKLPNVFSDSMVLQQKQENKVWGKDNPGQNVTVTIGNAKVSGTADASGNWQVKLPAMEIGDPLTMIVEGSSKVTLNDVLVGEVWICSGQSNMQWSINASNDPDLEKLTAKNTNIRMINRQ